MDNLSVLTTEATSNHNNLENMTTIDILEAMNQEDKTVPLAVEKACS